MPVIQSCCHAMDFHTRKCPSASDIFENQIQQLFDEAFSSCCQPASKTPKPPEVQNEQKDHGRYSFMFARNNSENTTKHNKSDNSRRKPLHVPQNKVSASPKQTSVESVDAIFQNAFDKAYAQCHSAEATKKNKAKLGPVCLTAAAARFQRLRQNFSAEIIDVNNMITERKDLASDEDPAHDKKETHGADKTLSTKDSNTDAMKSSRVRSQESEDEAGAVLPHPAASTLQQSTSSAERLEQNTLKKFVPFFISIQIFCNLISHLRPKNFVWFW